VPGLKAREEGRVKVLETLEKLHLKNALPEQL